MEPFRVSISVGHTHEAPGAKHEGTNLKEYNVCVDYLDVLVAVLGPDRRFDVVVVMDGVRLANRIEIVNSAHRDDPLELAIELHMNAFRTADPNYAEVYHFAYPDGRSSSLGKSYGDTFLGPLAEEMGSGDGKHDGLSEPFGDEEWERERWGFVRGCAPPALIVEPAFISNDVVAREIIESGLATRMAVGCYRSLVACLEV